MDDRDLETQPLLDQQISNDLNEDSQLTVPSPKRTKSRLKTFILYIIVAVSVVFFLRGTTPTDDVIQQSVMDVTDISIGKVNLDGWTDGSNLNNDSGKYLQISATANFTVDYDKWYKTNSTSELTDFQKSLFKNMNDKIIKEICFDFENVTTYNGIGDELKTLGSIFLKDPICVNIQQNVTTSVILTVLIKPHMKNIVDVLKKIWKKEYDELNIWSDMSVNLSRRSNMLFGYAISLAKIKGLTIEWNQYMNWKKNEDLFSELRHGFSDLKIHNINVADSLSGFDIGFSVRTPNFLKNFEMINLPRYSKFPKLQWNVILPDCKGNYEIPLTNTNSSTASFLLNQESNFDVICSSKLFSSFPDKLVNDICWYDEENIQTPMSKLIGNIFNSSELVAASFKPTIVQSDINNNYIIPLHLLDEVFDSISYIPIGINITATIDELVDNFTIEDLQIKWVTGRLGQKRLSVVGKLIGLLNLSFYETTKQKVSIQNIKGDILLYHNDNPFLSVPMKVWHNATSTILHDQDDGHTLMKLFLELPDDDIEILSKWELTKFFNEIMFEGSSLIHAEMNLDVIIKTVVGELVLLGINTENDIIVR